MSVKVAPNGRKVYISNGRAGTVSVLDSRSYELLNTIKVASVRGDGAFTRRKVLVHGQRTSNDVSVVDLEANKEIARIKQLEPWRWLSRPIRIERRICAPMRIIFR